MNAHATIEVADDRERVLALVRSLYEERGDIAATVAALELQAQADATLYMSVVNGHFHAICTRLVSSVVQRQRHGIWSTPPADAPSLDIAAFGAAVAGALMDFPLPGGKRLGGATKDDLIAGAYAYDAQIGDMMVKAKWLRAIAKTMPAGSVTVQEHLSEDKLRALKDEAKSVRRAA